MPGSSETVLEGITTGDRSDSLFSGFIAEMAREI